MPYTTCPACSLTVFSAAGYSTRDECPQCGAALAPDSHARRVRLLEQTAREMRNAGSAEQPLLQRRFERVARSLADAAAPERRS